MVGSPPYINLQVKRLSTTYNMGWSKNEHLSQYSKIPFEIYATLAFVHLQQGPDELC